MKKIFIRTNGELVLINVLDDKSDVFQLHTALGTLTESDTEYAGDFELPEGDAIWMYEHINGVICKKQAADTDAFRRKVAEAVGLIESRYSAFLSKKTGYPTEREVQTWNFKVGLADVIIRNSLLPDAEKVPFSAREQAFMAAAIIADWIVWAKKVLANSVNYSTILGLAETARTDAKVLVRASKIDSELDFAIIAAIENFDYLDGQP
ncbi:MAG: hypothetical protein PHP85_14500 [Gallionella sp.]|nr:hypothetical protein [Gallionella sp.]